MFISQERVNQEIYEAKRNHNFSLLHYWESKRIGWTETGKCGWCGKKTFVEMSCAGSPYCKECYQNTSL